MYGSLVNYDIRNVHVHIHLLLYFTITHRPKYVITIHKPTYPLVKLPLALNQVYQCML